MCRILAIIVLLFIIWEQNNCIPTIKLTNVVCESFNKSWLTIDYCRLKALRRDLTVLNLNATLVQPVRVASMQFELKKKANGYKPFLFNYTLDICANYRRPNHEVAKIMINLLKDVSNLNHTCPYTGLVVIRNLYVTTPVFRIPLPTGDYALFLTWFFSNRRQGLTNVYFQYNEDLIKQ